MDRKNVVGEIYTGERPFFGEQCLRIEDCSFDVGESAFKEASDIEVEASRFLGRYPVWYAKDVRIRGSYFANTCRAGLWYGENLSLEKCRYEGPKGLRRCNGITVTDVNFTNAVETLWFCKNADLKHVSAKGDYFLMNCEDVRVEDLSLQGKYSFDGCRRLEIRNSVLHTKDCFWNAEDITVYDSEIRAEYIGWNSKRITFVNCTIESLQGMCYIEDLKLVNCRLENTSLAFEYSVVDVESTTPIDSVMNPLGGRIRAPRIDKLILDPTTIDPEKTRIEAEVTERLEAFDGIIPGESTAAAEARAAGHTEQEA
ncbi:MAG: DUF3737 family protein [Eubacterium sp.]|nr:DUF3737 family protein [Eubacterium sp.]